MIDFVFIISGLLSGIFLCVYKFRLALNELRNLRDAEIRTPAAVKAIEDKKNKQIQGIVKNSIDLIIPAARLKWLPVSDGTVGLAGSITSVIGMIDTWPKAK